MERERGHGEDFLRCKLSQTESVGPKNSIIELVPESSAGWWRVKPGEEIRLVKENLAFAVSLWQAASAGKVPPAPLLRPTSEHPQFNQRAGDLRHSEAELAAEMIRGAANQMRAAFALSALQAQQSMADAFPGEPIEEEWLELRAARSSMYLIGLAVQRSILQPVWDCPPPYRRLFHIRRMGFTFNATGIEGRMLSWDDFGGLERYLSLLDYCAASADAAVERGDASRTLTRNPRPSPTEYTGIIGAPAEMTDGEEGAGSAEPPRGYPGEQPQRRLAPDAPPFVPPVPETVPSGHMDRRDNDAWEHGEALRPQNGHETLSGAPLPQSGPAPFGNIVHRFIAEKCEIGQDRRTLAGELYAGFLGWCRDSGHDPVSQRTFGMRLTNMGLTRKRRGHGKHWWEGIRLANTWHV